ncbi:MAG: subunit 17 of mediator complex-domain-containing protein [Benjaminiella poitrasii]|nr:MAG: subunit 17 of mediator complex-domain-containing protein [Benjaminiella poitrasii]
MSDQPTPKKIKLSLEPFIENNVVDITNAGQEILKTDVPLPEKLMQTVDRVWFERGKWKGITEKSLLDSIEKRNNQTNNDHQDTDDQDTSITPQLPQAPPGFDIVKLRESVINKLFHAKSEIDVALDVINILAASNHHNTSTKDLVLPQSSLSATYVTKPKPTTKRLLENTQLNLGLKRKKQKQASEFLKQSAESFKLLVEKEEVFWNEALDLRRNHWPLLAATHTNQGNIAGSMFLVQYGFTDAGSNFSEMAVGELKRSEDVLNTDVQLTFPHGSTDRRVQVCVSQSHMGQLEEEEEEANDADDSHHSTVTTIAQHNDLQRQLSKAHANIFDAELFSLILAEAQALNGNVRFPDDEIVINIDGQIDLSIAKIVVDNNNSKELITTTKQHSSEMIGKTIDLAFRLLLLQHQRYNLWKQRARLLSSSHKIHQLLNAHGHDDISSNAGTTTSAIGSIHSGHPNSARTMALRQRDPYLPQDIPILLPIMTATRFWVQFDRVRHVVESILNPLRGSMDISTHYTFTNPQLNKTNTTATTHNYDVVYPGYSSMSMNLSIHLCKGAALHFRLNQSGSISIHLPQTTVVLQNISEFETFLTREIKVICLRVVCEVANEMYQQQWQLDQVDEAIHGTLPNNKNVTIRFNSTQGQHWLEFHVDHQDTCHLELDHQTVMSFKERLMMHIQKIIK